jgi:hypothetical protein
LAKTVGQDNTRTEWVSTKHVKFTDKPTVLFRTARENVSASQVYTGTAYQTVTHGSSGSTQITFAGVVLEEGDVMRFMKKTQVVEQPGEIMDFLCDKVFLLQDTKILWHLIRLQDFACIAVLFAR